MPVNKDASNDKHKDKLLRELDCAVIEFMAGRIYEQIKKDIEQKGASELSLFDTIRGAFMEGGPAFKGAGIMAKTHIQVCVRNLNCIKGLFLPRKEVDYLNSVKSRNLFIFNELGSVGGTPKAVS